MSRRGVAIFLLSCVVGGVCLYLFLRNVDYPLLWRVLSSARLPWVVLAVAASLSLLPLRVLRWRLMLEDSSSREAADDLLAIVAVSFAANVIFPARLGEVVRVYLLKRIRGVSLAYGAATVVLERIFDMLTMIFFMVILIAFGEELFPRFRHNEAFFGAARAFVAAGVTGFLLLFTLVRMHDRLKGRIHSLWAERLSSSRAGTAAGRIASGFISGLSVLRTTRQTVEGSLLSLLLWSVGAFVYWFCAKAFGVEIGLLGSLLLFVLSCIAVALPQAPGYIGPYQLAVEFGLGLLGIGGMVAKGIAIVVWAVGALPVLFVGTWYFWRSGMRLDVLFESSGEEGGNEPD